MRRICPCRFTLTLSLTSSAACAATEGGMAHAHAHARQPQIAPSCHVRARTKPAHDTIPIRRVCQCRGNESTSSSAPPPLGTSSSAPPPQPLLLSPSSSAPPPNASTHRQLERSCLPASQPRHLFSLLPPMICDNAAHSRPDFVSVTIQTERTRARARHSRPLSLLRIGRRRGGRGCVPKRPRSLIQPPRPPSHARAHRRGRPT